MRRGGGWSYLGNLATLFSLVNGVVAFLRNLGAGTRSLSASLHDPTVRIQLWASAATLFIAGLLAMIYLFRSTADVASDLQDGSVRQRITTLLFGTGQIAVGFVLAGVLLVAG